MRFQHRKSVRSALPMHLQIGHNILRGACRHVEVPSGSVQRLAYSSLLKSATKLAVRICPTGARRVGFDC